MWLSLLVESLVQVVKYIFSLNYNIVWNNTPHLLISKMQFICICNAKTRRYFRLVYARKSNFSGNPNQNYGGY